MSRLSHARAHCTVGAIAGTPLAVLGAGHGLTGLAIGATAVILATAITALAPELFWLLALRQPARDLHRLLRQLPPQDAERFAGQLNDAYGKAFAARVAHTTAGLGNPGVMRPSVATSNRTPRA
jgi:hypothetical protein